MAFFKKAGELIKARVSKDIARVKFRIAERKTKKEFAASEKALDEIASRKKVDLSAWKETALKTILFASSEDDPKIRDNGFEKLKGIVYSIEPGQNLHLTIANLVAFCMLVLAHYPVAHRKEFQEQISAFLPDIEKKLFGCLGDKNEEVRFAAAKAMGAIPAVGLGKSRMAQYAEALMKGDEWQRHGAVLAIAKLFSCDSSQKLILLLSDDSKMVRTSAFETLKMFIIEHHPNKLGIWFEKTFISPLSTAMESTENPECKALIVRLLGLTHDYRAATPLGKALADPNELVRGMAEKALLTILEHNYYDEMMIGFHSAMELGAKEWRENGDEASANAKLRLGIVKRQMEMKVGRIENVDGPYR